MVRLEAIRQRKRVRNSVKVSSNSNYIHVGIWLPVYEFTPRVLRTLSTARVVRIACNLLQALGGQFVEPVDHLGIAAPLIDEAGQAITAVASRAARRACRRSLKIIAPSRGMTFRTQKIGTPEFGIGQVDQAHRGLFECRLGGHIMHRAEPVAEKLDDYFVIVKRCGGPRRGRHWTWEIRHRSKPLGVKFDGDEYATPQDAKLAGEKALKELLHILPNVP